MSVPPVDQGHVADKDRQRTVRRCQKFRYDPLMSDPTDDVQRKKMKAAASDPIAVAARIAFARHTADTFKEVGFRLHLGGHIFGKDRRDGLSPFGHGDDAAVAVSMLLQIGSQLVSGCADLISDGRAYAGAALVRQLVEVEYLAWAFETKDAEAARWLRSTKDERLSFFAPVKLRKAAGARFRSADYGYHCELGGHPVPGSWRLLNDDVTTAQLMLSDCLGHSTRIWGHVYGWSNGTMFDEVVKGADGRMREQYEEWQCLDRLTILQPPPEE